MATSKAQQTRRTIVDTALRLFRRDGYDRTTMRAIAAEAGISVGSAYYYFGSKEHLVQAFYDGLQAEHAAASAAILAGKGGFAERLEGVLLAWLDVAEPHHAFAGQFFRNAADPHSPLSPFSPESAPARDASIALFERLVADADLKLAPAVRRELPGLLWLMQMGVVLFWVYDDSEGQARSRILVRRVVPLVDRLVRMSRLPVVRGVVDDAVALVAELRG
jgi:AcrR family transcriptional regulator